MRIESGHRTSDKYNQIILDVPLSKKLLLGISRDIINAHNMRRSLTKTFKLNGYLKEHPRDCS